MNDLRTSAAPNLVPAPMVPARSNGQASADSSRVLVDILAEAGDGRRLRLLELGCGNGQFARTLFERGLDCDYTGVDFSQPLLEAGRRTFARDDRVRFLHGDIEVLDNVSGRFDFVIYSHALEMLASPERSLRAARRFAERVLIRFFEPPDFETTSVELRQMDLGAGAVPYLHWKMGRSFYRLMLAELDAKRVDIYRTPGRDQVHVVHV